MTEVTYSTELVLPQSGVLVDLTDEKEVSLAYRDVHDLKLRLEQAERQLRAALAERAKVAGSKTFYIAGVGRVEVKGGTKTIWDEQKLEDLLRKAGAPEELIREIVVEQVSYKVDARRAQRAAIANPDYAAAIEASREEEPVLPTVSVST